jgi:hypothetical protein
MAASTTRMTSSASPSEPEPETTPWLQVVERKVSGLRFGSVQIVVHEGRVTQIESTEKFRFQSPVQARAVADGAAVSRSE